MQERRILNGLIDLNSIPSSAIEITTDNISSTLGNVFYIPMYICLHNGGTEVQFYILHVYGAPYGPLLSINNFPIDGRLGTEDVGNSISSSNNYTGSNNAIMFSLPKTYARYTYSTPAYEYYYSLYLKFNIYTSYDTFDEGYLGFKSMVSEIIKEPDFKPYAVVKLSGQYKLAWVNGTSSVKSAYLTYPPIYIDNE